MNDSDNFQILPTVGPQKENILNEDGYYTYEDLSKAHPLLLNRECNIVLASASNIIVSAVEELDGACPNCSHSDGLSPAWSSSKRINPPSNSSDLKCVCGWDGKTSELVDQSSQVKNTPESV